MTMLNYSKLLTLWQNLTNCYCVSQVDNENGNLLEYIIVYPSISGNVQVPGESASYVHQIYVFYSATHDECSNENNSQ